MPSTTDDATNLARLVREGTVTREVAFEHLWADLRNARESLWLIFALAEALEMTDVSVVAARMLKLSNSCVSLLEEAEGR